MALVLALLMWLTPAVAGLVQIPYPARVLCAVVLVCVGQGIIVAGMVAFRRAKTTVNPVKASLASTLVIRGVYRYTRNPMYVGLLLTLMVVPGCVGTLGLFILALGLGTALRGSGLPAGTVNLILLTCTLAVPLLARLASRRLGLADNRPLRETVASIYGPELGKGDPEVMCTLASVRRWSLGTRTVCATYPTLAKINNPDEAIDVLVQSAALPEIFPMKKLQGSDCVDRGVEDNTPILGVYPIQPTRVFVVYLDHRHRLMLERRKKANYGTTLIAERIVWSQDVALKLWEGNRLQAIAERRGNAWEGPLRSGFWSL